MEVNRLGAIFPQRHYVRLVGHDYRQGTYFVTICTHEKRCLFGVVERGVMSLNAYGAIVWSCWEAIPRHYCETDVHVFTVMPNHVHGIISIGGETGRSGSKPDPTGHALSEIVRGFKTYSSRGVNGRRNSPGARVWQRSFFEHAIRSESEYCRIGEYILYNAAKWEMDPYRPLAQP